MSYQNQPSYISSLERADAAMGDWTGAETLFSNAEAAAYIGVEKETLDCWRCSGRYLIPFIKVGRLVKYRKSDLDEWLNSRRVGN